METLNIIDSRYRNRLIKHLLQNKSSLINQRFENFDQIFYSPFNSIERLLHFKALIQTTMDDFSLLKPSLQFDDTYKQALDFLDDCDRYQIDLESLPTNTPLNSEKTLLIKHLSQLHRPYQNHKSIDNKEVNVYPFYTHLYHHLMFEQLNISYPEIKINPTQKRMYKSALNPRQEISGVIEYLNKHTEIESVLICCADSSYYPEIKRQFSLRSHSISLVDYQQMDNLFIAYFYLVKALKEHDVESFKSFYSLNIFNDKNIQDLLTVINLYQPSFDELLVGLKELDHDFDTELKHQLINQKKIYKNAQKLSVLYANRFLSLDFNNLIVSVFELFSQNLPQSNSLFSLKSTIEENYSLITDENMIDVLELMLLNPRQQASVDSNIIVSDLTYFPSTPFDLVIYLGMTQNNFPNFTSYTGLYNEDYIKEIGHFPKLQDRINHHNSQLINSILSLDNVIISTPTMDYTGSLNETAFEINELFNFEKPQAWDIHESVGSSNIISDINPETSRQIFYPTGDVIGSVSTLEMYTKNSLKYFLEKGLRLSTTNPFDLDVATIGSLSHKVFELLVKKYEKDYVNTSLAEIEEMLQPTFDQLNSFYPFKKKHYELSQKRLAAVVKQNLEQLKDYELNGEFTPNKDTLELRFNQLRLYDNIDLLLNGIIDRIDYAQDGSGFIIIDYKSSPKSLSHSLVVDGQQLQLLTYALVGQKILQSVCLGVYYAELSQALENKQNFKLNLSSLTFDLETKIPKPLKGKALEESITAYLKPRAKNHYFYKQKVEPYFEKLYNFIVQSIKEGKLTQFIQNDDYFTFNDLQRNQQSYPSIQSLHQIVDEYIDLSVLQEVVVDDQV